MKKYALAMAVVLVAVPRLADGTANFSCDGGITYSECPSGNACKIDNDSYFINGFCGSESIVYARDIGMRDCNQCEYGSTRTSATITITAGLASSCSYTFNYCTCLSPVSCSDGKWTAYSSAYQKRTYGYAICSTCASVVQYRCADGYYGKEPNPASNSADAQSATGCTVCPANATCAVGDNKIFKCNNGYYKSANECSQCPASGSVYGITSGLGATDITQCYFPKDTSTSDLSGAYQFTLDCQYVKD